MTYGDYVIGGITPGWIEATDYTSFDEGKVVLNCAAYTEDDVTYAMTEIEEFIEMSSLFVSSTKLLNGGIGVQASNDLVECTLGNEVYMCAVGRPTFKEDSFSKALILWTLTLYPVIEGGTGSSFYKPPLDAYDNVEYYYGSDQTDHPDELLDEAGYLEITETRPVRRVEIHGSACGLPSWVEVNGERLYWHYSHSDGETNKDVETLVWEFPIPVNVITIQSSTHTTPWSGEFDRGFWPQNIRVVYA